MKNAILLHGTCDRDEYFNENLPSLSNSHWFPWMQKQLIITGISTQTPEMPNAYIPDYKSWENEFTKFKIDEDTILVGHSCGGGFLLRWLSENKIPTSKLILVAPWLDPARVKTKDFFDFQIDPNLARRTQLHILISRDDEEDILQSVEQIKLSLPSSIEHIFENMGHFTHSDMGTPEFHDLLKIIIT